MNRQNILCFPSAPISYAVEITYQCNNACSGCANVLERHRHRFLSDWKSLFDQIAPPEQRMKYAELIRITGGEPTLHHEFSQIIAYVDTFGIPHATFTNGLWRNPQAVVSTFAKCQNFIGALISLHGSTAAAHAAFTDNHEATFEEVCANIRRAADSGLEVFTNTVLTKFSCEQIEEMIALSQKLGATYTVFNRYLGKPHPNEPAEEQLRQAIRLIERLQHDGVPCRIGDCVPYCFEKNSTLGSNGGIEHCVISPLGDVRPENLTSYTFGNIFEESIEDIWSSEKIQWYRQQIPSNCLDCVALPHCRGGCRSMMVEYALANDPLMKAPIHESLDNIELHPDFRPLPFFNLRQEAFGYLLVRLNWSIPVSFEAKPLIDAINERETLSELYSQFGDDALDFIGYLAKQRFIDFE